MKLCSLTRLKRIATLVCLASAFKCSAAPLLDDLSPSTPSLPLAWTSKEGLLQATTPDSRFHMKKLIEPGSSSYYFEVMAVDLDDDGYSDIVASNTGSPARVSVFYNVGGVSWQRQEISVPKQMEHLDSADVNEDGRLDIVCASEAGFFGWIENQGNNSFQLHTVLTNSNGIEGIRTADIDHDKHLEIFAFHNYYPGPGGLYVYRWQEDALIEVALVPGTSGAYTCRSFAFADFNHDTYLDLVKNTYSEYGTKVYIHMFENTESLFTAGAVIYENGNGYHYVQNNLEIANLDGDSKLNIILPFFERIGLVYLRDLSTNGTQWQQVVLGINSDDSYDSVASAAATDVDGDGDLDIVAYGVYLFDARYAWLSDRQLSWYENLGPNGNFSARTPIYGDFQCDVNTWGSVPLGDFDGDGWLDIAFSCGNTVSWIRNDPCEQHCTPIPTHIPTLMPTPMPTSSPTQIPTPTPSLMPTPMPTSSPTSMPTRAPSGCGELQPNRKGSSAYIHITPPDVVDFEKCCNHCSSNAACLGFSYFRGNASDEARSCLLFEQLLSADDESTEYAAGWYSGFVIQDEAVEQSLIATLLGENAYLSVGILVAVVITLVLFIVSKMMEASAKRVESRAEIESVTVNGGAQSVLVQEDNHAIAAQEPSSAGGKVGSGKHVNILLTGLAFIDIVVDWAFVIERFRIENNNDPNVVHVMPLLAAIFLALPMLISLIYVIRFLRREFQDEQVGEWFFANSALGTIICLLAVGNPEVLAMFVSKTFGCHRLGSVFNAPLSKKSREQLYLAGAIGNLSEDIPQMGFQAAVIYNEGASSLTKVALATSLMTLVFGFSRRVFLYIMFQQKRAGEIKRLVAESEVASQVLSQDAARQHAAVSTEMVHVVSPHQSGALPKSRPSLPLMSEEKDPAGSPVAVESQAAAVGPSDIGGVEFSQQSEALPMPVSATTDAAIAIISQDPALAPAVQSPAPEN